MYKTAIVRFLSVAASAGVGIVGIRSAITLDDARSAPIISLLCWATFIGLGQLGWGRPAYTLLRQALARNGLTETLLARILNITRRQAIIASLIFTGLAVPMAIFLGLKNDLLSFLILAFGMSTIGAATFWRDAAYALSCEESYEMLELARRLTLLGSFFMLGLDVPESIMGATCVLIAILTIIHMDKMLRRVACAQDDSLADLGNKSTSSTDEVAIVSELRFDARRQLVFSVSELCLYNSPLIVYSALNRSSAIIDFSMWSKLFMLVVLPMRIIADARLNFIMHYHFKGDGNRTTKSLQRSIYSAVGIATCSSVMTISTMPWLIDMMAPGHDWDAFWLPTSIIAWGLLNALQHVYGSYTVSHGEDHSFAWSASLTTSLSVIVSIFLGDAIGLNFWQTMCLASIPYAISAVAFAQRAYQAIPKKG